MTMALDMSPKTIIAGPIPASEDERPFYKYQAESDGRTFWAINGYEVWYEDERLYHALDQVWKLRCFVKELMADWPDVGSIDGFDLQEFCTKHGILVPEHRTTLCDPECNCAEYYSPEDIAAGFTCYRLAPELCDGK